jgi:hydroxyacylglutathione hydrolase
VRTDKEWDEGHIEGALHIYVGHLEEQLDMIPDDHAVAVICSVGNRGSLAASILRRAGHQNVFNGLGGMVAWNKAGCKISRV